MKIEATEEEIATLKTALENGTTVTDPDLKAFLDKLGSPKVLSTAQETNYKANLENAWAARTDKANYTAIDTRIAELSGVAKNADEKTSDYVARALTGLKEKVGKPDEAAKTELEGMRTKLKAAEDALAAEKVNATTALVKERATLEARAEVEKLKAQFPEMPEGVLKDIVEVRLGKFLAENAPTADEAGNLVYTDPKNNNARRLDTAGNNAPLGTGALLAPYFADLKKADAGNGTGNDPKPAGGGGAGAGKSGGQGNGNPPPPGPGAAKGINGLPAQRPAELTSRVKVWDYLKEKGHTNTTEGFNDTYNAWIANADGSKLPEE